MQPSLTTLMGRQFTDTTANLGSLVLKQMNLSGISKMFSDMASTVSISKMIAEYYASNVGSIGQALAAMHRSQSDAMFQSVDIQKAMANFSRAFTQSVETANVSSLLRQASSLQGAFDDHPDIEHFAAVFLEEQPELAASIEQLPFLITLSTMDRKLIVWFIAIVVSIYVTMGLVTIGTDNPELHSLLGDLGIGSGMAAGAVAGRGTKKLLDRLPEAENE